MSTSNYALIGGVGALVSTGGSPPNNVSITSVSVIDTTPSAAGVAQKQVTIVYAPPGSIGSFTGVWCYGDMPDQSVAEINITDGSIPADGVSSAGVSAAFNPTSEGYFPYNAATPQISFVVPAPTVSQYWRFYLCSGSQNSQVFPVEFGQVGATPSYQILVSPPTPLSTGREYAPNVSVALAPSSAWPSGWTANPYVFTLASGDQVFLYDVLLTWPDSDQNYASLGGVNIALQVGALLTYPGNYSATLGTSGGVSPYIPGIPINVLPGTTTYTAYFISYDVNGNENSLVPNVTPSVTFTITRKLGLAGEEYCAPVSGDGVHNYVVVGTNIVAADGSVSLNITGYWNAPSDPQFGGVQMVALKPDGNYYALGAARLSPLQEFVPPPATLQTWAFFLVSVDINGNRNSIGPRVAFSGGGGSGAVFFPVVSGGSLTGTFTQISGGTGYTSAPTATLVDGQGNPVAGVTLTAHLTGTTVSSVTNSGAGSGIVATPAVTNAVGSNTGLLNLGQAASGTFNATQFAIVAGALVINEISANIIVTGELQVGGGSNMVSIFQIFDTLGNLIGWVGDGVYASGGAGFVGAWFKQVYIGGSSPSSAQIVANSAGNVTISGSLIVGAVANATNAVNANSASNATNATLASQVPAGGIQAGTIYATVTMTAPTLIISAGGGATINIDAYNYIKLSDGVGRLIQLTQSLLTIATTTSSRSVTADSSGVYCADSGSGGSGFQLFANHGVGGVLDLYNYASSLFVQLTCNTGLTFGSINCINTSGTFVGAGVLCPLYGIAGAGFNPYVSGVQYFGQTLAYQILDTNGGLHTVKGGVIVS